MTNTDNHKESTAIPNDAAFISRMPCVSGNTITTFLNGSGMISNGNVVPEKINIGKYNALAITLAIFAFLAIPPTIMPILRIDSTVRIQLPINANRFP